MPKNIGALTHDSAWAITEAGLVQYQRTVEAIQDKIAAHDGWDTEDGEDKPNSEILQIEGSVGIISIKGVLVNSDSFWNKYFGLISYNTIRSALIEAATREDVQTILMDIDSPGGAVNGVVDTTELIGTIDATLKPVYAYTDGNMCSGAYWLGCSARSVYASSTAQIGSVGVVMNLMERSKMLADMGITPTVIRAGRYKQIGNPNEPLTEEGRAELQSMVDSIYKVFVTHVSQERKKPYDYADKVMAQGRVFLGENAVEVGLADKITSFDALLAEFSAKKVDRSSFSFENNGIGANMSNNKKPLISAVQAALVAAGHIPATEIDSNTLEVEVDAEALAAAAAATATAAAANIEDTETTAETEVESTEGEGTEDGPAVITAKIDSSTVDTSSEAVTLLKAQIKERDEQLIDAKVESRTLTKQLEQVEASMAGLKAIAVKSINAMQVALNRGAVSYDDKSATEVLAAHETLSADFTKNFKVGGVAAVEPNTTTEAKRDGSDSLRAARLNATKL